MTQAKDQTYENAVKLNIIFEQAHVTIRQLLKHTMFIDAKINELSKRIEDEKLFPNEDSSLTAKEALIFGMGIKEGLTKATITVAKLIQECVECGKPHPSP